MNEFEYKKALRRSEYLMDLEEHGITLTKELKLELNRLIEGIEEYEKDMI